ncbi:cell division protein FtsH, partial [PVC group bacterium]|nr:cell division protein FtsH [PVC group bacterium]
VMAETEPLHKVTIIPRGVAYLGATMSLPEKDRYTQNRKRLLGELAGMMGGRAAEEIIFGDITNGSAQDIKQATEIAHLMVCNWGMSEEIGPQKLGENQELMFLGREVSRTQNYSEATAKKIDEEIYKLLKSSHEKATEILLKYREQLEIIAQRLLDRETIDGRDVEEMVEHGRVLSSEERDKIDQEKEAEDGERKSEGEMVETEVVDDAVAPVADDKADTA